MSSAKVVILALLMSACSSPVAPDRMPAWVTTMIRSLEAKPVANPPAFVASYEYKGDVVYYVPPRCCDVWGTVFKADGSILCHPNGGVDGNGDGRCVDFLTARRNERIIWRDPRR